MKKIVFLTGTIRSDTSWPMLFAKGLADHKAEVLVVSGYANINVDKTYREHQLMNPIEKISDNLTIVRVGSKRKEKNSLLRRFLRYITLTEAIYNEAKKHDADCYYIYSTPPFLGLLGRKLQKLGKTIYIAQDLFPDSLFAIKPKLEKSILGFFLRYLEKRIYLSNSAIVTISDTMKDRISSRGISSDKINVIFNWSNIEKLHHVSKTDNVLYDQYGVSRSKFVVSYAGNLGLLQGIDKLLDVAQELKSYQDIEFVIFGNGVCKEKLVERVNKEDLFNVKILPLQPPELISEAYSFGDVEFVSVKPGVMKMACPHKIFDIFSVGNAILAAIDIDSDIAKLIKEKELGYAIAMDIESLKNVIIQMYHSRSFTEKMGINARHFAETIDYKSQIQMYIDLI